MSTSLRETHFHTFNSQYQTFNRPDTHQVVKNTVVSMGNILALNGLISSHFQTIRLKL